MHGELCKRFLIFLWKKIKLKKVQSAGTERRLIEEEEDVLTCYNLLTCLTNFYNHATNFFAHSPFFALKGRGAFETVCLWTLMFSLVSKTNVIVFQKGSDVFWTSRSRWERHFLSPTYGVHQPLRILWCIRHKQFLNMLAYFIWMCFLNTLQERISLSLSRSHSNLTYLLFFSVSTLFFSFLILYSFPL